MIYFCSKCLLVCWNHQTYYLMIPKNLTWTLHQCLYTFSIEMYTSGITVWITATSPCIFLYVHKMSHTKPVPGPVSLQDEAGPGPVMPMPMLPIALTMLPMRRQWVKPCNHRRKLGPPLWTEFSKSMFQPSNFISAPKSEYPYSFISECTVIDSPSLLKALFRGMISCKLLHNPTRPYSNTFPTAFSTSFVSRSTDLLPA